MTGKLSGARCLGLTGGIGAGKSTVAGLLVQRGFCHIDADLLGREALCSPEIQRQLCACFGADIVVGGPEPEVDRSLLARRAFESAASKAKLDAISHPYIRARALALMQAAPGRCVLDAALLFEAGWHTLVEASVVVLAPQELRLVRAAKRLALPISELRPRLQGQFDDAKRRALDASFIYNVGDIDCLRRQVQRVFGL